MRKNFIYKIIPLLLVMVLLTSCSTIKLHLPEQQKSMLESYVWANEAHSTYYYDQLDPSLQGSYTKMVEACLSLNEKVSLDKSTPDEIAEIIRAIIRDYPAVFWLDDTYTFAKGITNTSVALRYTKTKEIVDIELAQLDKATTDLLSDISPDLSDYDKALLAHDKLVNSITYNLDAENQRSVYGAIVQKDATCEGYAKAYQFMLAKLGIESIVVYGMAEEPHAWNIVNLDGDYYFVDVTFDDRDLVDGGEYLSREYLFVTSEEMAKTHTLATDEANSNLPNCTATEQNYFVKNNLLLTVADRATIRKVIKQETLKAIEKRDTSFQIRFADDKTGQLVSDTMLDTGYLDQSVNIEVSRYQGVKYSGRTFEKTTNVITFLLDY